MPWTAPTLRITGELITAAIWNTDLVSDLLLLKTAHDDSGNLSAAAATTLTLATGACTPTQNHHAIDTQAGASTDNLNTLTIAGSIRAGVVVILTAANLSHVITVKNGIGNLTLKGGDFVLSTADRAIGLQLRGTTWYEVFRSDQNGILIVTPEIKNYVETVTAPTIVTTSKTISANSLANPTVILTSTAHGWSTGDFVKITGSNSTPSIDGVRQITVIDATHFSVAVNVTVAGTAGTVSRSLLSLDLSSGCEFDVALNSDITQFAFTNVPSTTKVTTVTIRFTADGTLRTITWPTTWKWPAAAPPPMTSTNAKVDVVTARTYDGGVTAWYPAFFGQNM